MAIAAYYGSKKEETMQRFATFIDEKKGHFRIRKYFDLYLTQGPFFTKKFNELKKKFKNFEVVETGWPKLDIYGKELHIYDLILTIS